MELIKYQLGENNHIDTLYDIENETIWMSQQMIALLFGKHVKTIGKHILEIMNEGELNTETTSKKYPLIASNGKTYETKIYEAEIIIEISCRVKSIQSIRFRRWMRQIIKEKMAENIRNSQPILIHSDKDIEIESNLKKGYVYILTNKQYQSKSIFKIGKTKDLDSRLCTYNSARIDEDLMFYHKTKFVDDASSTESQLHKLLDSYRYKDKKEMYQINLTDLEQIFDTLLPQSATISITINGKTITLDKNEVTVPANWISLEEMVQHIFDTIVAYKRDGRIQSRTFTEQIKQKMPQSHAKNYRYSHWKNWIAQLAHEAKVKYAMR